MTVQPLYGWLDRITGEGALQDGEHAVPLLAERVEAGANDAEVFGAGERAESRHRPLRTLTHLIVRVR